MFKTNKIANSVRLALIASMTSLVIPSAFSAEEESRVERIQVTGSSINRTDLEGALPITNITAEEITKTGVTAVSDLIALIPSMQGFTTPSQSVGGGGGGVAEASLRGIGAEYTLVLLNGKRLAPSGSGSSVDVNSIPIAAIERVEILTDGASALYGSDAIAGVINFILKKDIQETTISARYDRPQDTGGSNGSFSITTGVGDLSQDGFNVYFSYSREQQDALASKDREHSKTGIIPFSHNGDDLVFVADSANAIPANAFIGFSNGTEVELNPYAASNGSCAVNNVPSSDRTFDDDGNLLVTSDICRFDFTSTLEIIPEYVRDNVLLGGVLELNDATELYSTISLSRFEITPRIAPYPTGGFPVSITSDLFLDNVYPHLTTEQQGFIDNGEVDYSVAAWRALPGGNRTNEYTTDSRFFDLGLRGELNEISYDISLNYSDSTRDDKIVTGYPVQEDFLALLGSGNLGVFGLAEDLSDDEVSALQATMFSGLDTVTETDLLSINGKFSAPVYELSAGDIYVGGGFDYRETSYSRRGSDSNQQAVILFADPDPQFDLERSSYGLFLETIVPLFEGFELNAAVRYDDISAIDNTTLQNPFADDDDLIRDSNGVIIPTGSTNQVGTDLSDTTYKVSFTYRPNDNWLLRASLGTGFKAPTMREIAEPRIPFGVTGGVYQCPFSGSDPLAQFCRTGNNQYDVFREGNAGLEPEESEQSSFGFVYSSDDGLSVSIDYWKVDLENVVQRPTEQNIFNDPVTFRELYTTKLDQGRGEDFLAIIQGPVNVGQSNNEGIDWSVDFSNELGWAELKTSISGTYMIESESLKVGTTDVFESSLGEKGPDDNVVFRNKIRIVNALNHGDFVHTVNVTYQSGYTDENFGGGDNSIRLASDLGKKYSGGVQLDVPSHAIVDWLTQYHYNDNTTVSFGISNLFDKLPPLALGENGGHQEGFDPRYFDSYGRTFYLSGSYRF
jgi:iron complex outermembrane receptor protein